MQIDAEHLINKVPEGGPDKEMTLKTSGGKILVCLVLRETGKKTMNIFVKALHSWKAFPVKSSETFGGQALPKT